MGRLYTGDLSYGQVESHIATATITSIHSLEGSIDIVKPSVIVAPLAPLYAMGQINSQHVRRARLNKQPQLVCMHTNTD